MMSGPDDKNNDINITRPKINIYMLSMFFILSIPILVYTAFKYFDENIEFFIDRHLGIEKTMRPGKESSNFQKEERLRALCDEFLAAAGKYGYTPKEIINEIKQH